MRGMSGRCVMVLGKTPAVVYVDEAGCGHHARNDLHDWGRYNFSTHSPERMTSENCVIYGFEMCAPISGLRITAEFAPGRDAILFGDRRGATQTLVRGAWVANISRMMRIAFWPLAESSAFPALIVDVVGALNPAGDPPVDFPACNYNKVRKGGSCAAPLILLEFYSRNRA